MIFSNIFEFTSSIRSGKSRASRLVKKFSTLSSSMRSPAKKKRLRKFIGNGEMKLCEFSGHGFGKFADKNFKVVCCFAK